MWVKHEKYGIGYADKPYKDYGSFLIDVKFNCGIKKFTYPDTFNNKTLIEIEHPAITNTISIQEFKAKLLTVLSEYIADFNKKKNNPIVVKNSIPIVWFGDIDKYINSTKRILTVGLNPSDKEFTEKRFDIIAFDNIQNEIIANNLTATLNNYFYFRPYKKWFNNYEKILHIFNCSYGGKMPTNYSYENQAIHIDLYSSIATSPTWGKLTEAEKKQIENKELFFKFFNILNPDITLISVNKNTFKSHFSDWQFDDEKHFSGKNYITIREKNGKYIINGTNMQGNPFQGIKDTEKEEYLLSFIKKFQ